MDSQTADNFRSLDLGFSLSDNDCMLDIHGQPESDILDMQFPILYDDDWSDESEGPLEMECPPESADDVFNMGCLLESGDDGESLHAGFNINPTPYPANSLPNHLDISDPSGNTEYGALEMRLNIHPVDDVPDIGNNIQSEENPLEMGFEMDPVHDALD
ncbi:uncharacterized protein HD556DRAFT_1441426 [Suillus plorans]|uniref:Uncharacterized protein n=1 Tax=Suillus plorans TaxID=116603 RepID=A0A9P7ATW8_9AGAM|nr:uncharacterized protein HD556DRAFT_1441426 [Suillus plorans]KAG1796733.1 hypothetical protein HD556DRAFT_1441426 [Suillus plorans]